MGGLYTIPDDVVQMIASDYSKGHYGNLELHTTEKVAQLVRLLSKICVSSSAYEYYIAKVGVHISAIKASIVAKILPHLSPLKNMDSVYGFFSDDTVNLCLHFNNITKGFTYDDFALSPNQIKGSTYWYCCVSSFLSKRVVEDFIATEPVFSGEITLAIFFAITGQYVRQRSYELPRQHFFDDNINLSINFTNYYLPDAEIDVISLYLSDSDSSDDEDARYIFASDYFESVIMLIDQVHEYESISNYLSSLVKKDVNCLLNHSGVKNRFDFLDILVYVYRRAQQQKVCMEWNLNMFLSDLAISKNARQITGQYENLSLLDDALRYNDVNIFKNFLESENERVDALVSVPKRYVNTKKEKRARWMRFDREFADLPHTKRDYKRNISERCHKTNHSLTYVNEEDVDTKELAMYETDDDPSVKVLKVTRYDGKMNIR